MIACSNCGTQNEAARKFCKECGTSLAVGCPNCGTANTADSKFCGNCGTALNAAVAGGRVAGPTPAPPVAERRLVSILFADLVGFTTLAEGRDPEETRDLLSRYFTLAREVIERHGGTVEKFIGDAVMAVWGAPVAREDDAELAVRAALALVDSVKTIGPDIEARAGVLTGEAAGAQRADPGRGLPGRVSHAARASTEASVAALEGRTDDALDGFRDAVVTLRELDHRVLLGLTLTDFAIALGPAHAEAAAAGSEARDLWTTLGLTAMLARLDDGLARWPSVAVPAAQARVTAPAS